MSFLTRKEEIIMIAIWKLGGNAYGVSIRDKVIELSKQNIVYGTLYNSLEYLIRKGYVSSKKGDPTPERGGKSKTIYSITNEGEIALQKTRELQEQVWQDMPKFKFGTSYK
jgi:DNA-binding PadR family transcriptional regulator